MGLGILVVILSGFVALREERVASNDWSGIWAGPRTLVLGGDPYAATTWVEDALRLQDQVPSSPVYGYPGHVLLALLPFGLLPLEAAALVWGAGGIALAILGLRALLRSCVPALPIVHTLAGLALIASQPGIATLHNGQWGFALVALASLAVTSLRGGHDRRAGGALALAALAKPQLFLVSAPLLLRAAASRGRPRVLVTFAAVAGGLIATSVAVLPHWPAEWIAVAAARLPLRPQATAVPTALGDLAGPAGIYLGAAIMIGCALAALAFDPRSDAALAVALAAGGVVVPYSWSYDHLLLIVPLVIGAGVLAARSRAAAIGLMTAGSLLLLLLGTLLHGLYGDARGSESYNALVPLAMAALVIAGLWPVRNARRPVPGSRHPLDMPASGERN